MKLVIDKQNFELEFGFKVFSVLSKMWKLQGVNSIFKRVITSMSWAMNLDFQNLKSDDFENLDIPIESFEVLADIIGASIVANKKNNIALEDLEAMDLENWVFLNQEEMGPIMTAFIDAMPRPKESVEPGKRNAVKK
jgi:hypothetical protein